ncbi:MAG: hypothetical protein AAF623_05565 [Planctomycetota bacterium]
MMGNEKYLSETVKVGSRTYLVEVRRYRDKQRYMIITQPELGPEQQPVIVFENQMQRFMDVMDLAFMEVTKTTQVVSRVPIPKPRKVKANPPEFCNSGKRWTQSDDQLLIEKYQAGESLESLMSTFKRRTKAIEVRLFKLGVLPTNDK